LNLILLAIFGAYAIFTAICAPQFIHEYVHVLQLRPRRPSQIVLLGWKEGGWGGWVTGAFPQQAERRQELQAHVIDLIVTILILLPFILMFGRY
jgi:hypothetical protein